MQTIRQMSVNAKRKIFFWDYHFHGTHCPRDKTYYLTLIFKIDGNTILTNLPHTGFFLIFNFFKSYNSTTWLLTAFIKYLMKYIFFKWKNEIKTVAGIRNVLLHILDRSNVKPSFSFSSPFPFSFDLKKKIIKFFAESNKHSREERDKGRKDFEGYSPGFLRSLIQSYESCGRGRNNIFLHLDKNKRTKKGKEHEHRVTVSYFLISN